MGEVSQNETPCWLQTYHGKQGIDGCDALQFEY